MVPMWTSLFSLSVVSPLISSRRWGRGHTLTNLGSSHRARRH